MIATQIVLGKNGEVNYKGENVCTLYIIGIVNLAYTGQCSLDTFYRRKHLNILYWTHYIIKLVK